MPRRLHQVKANRLIPVCRAWVPIPNGVERKHAQWAAVTEAQRTQRWERYRVGHPASAFGFESKLRPIDGRLMNNTSDLLGYLAAVLRSLETVVNIATSEPPIVFTTVRIATPIPAAIKPYSIAVTPHSSVARRFKRFMAYSPS